ncbi:glycosyltransferase family protein [Danxiaibacter flavus]|uniref:Glycosyltransferase family protein n=1 Tax=Danxiaibacter flavus TaxID=3049108 RepID=A0ABV3ZHA4_9BACT|nr:glycosyltransferase family protein [Chitinophagaceae bacterium DXS]
MKVLLITQARYGSTRLPGKVLMEVLNKQTLLDVHLKRILTSKRIDKAVVATTHEKKASRIIDIAFQNGIEAYRGDTHDVLDRFYKTAFLFQPEYIVRVTSDCPLIDGSIIDLVVGHLLANELDYVSNTLERTYPDGLDVEAFTFKALELAWKEAHLNSDREHVTPFIWRNSSFRNGSLFKSANVSCENSFGEMRLTVDEYPDLLVVQKLIVELGTDKNWMAYVDLLIQNPAIAALNSHFKCNEGYVKSLAKDIT